MLTLGLSEAICAHLRPFCGYSHKSVCILKFFAHALHVIIIIGSYEEVSVSAPGYNFQS